MAAYLVAKYRPTLEKAYPKYAIPMPVFPRQNCSAET
jgi:hypothetical protein